MSEMTFEEVIDLYSTPELTGEYYSEWCDLPHNVLMLFNNYKDFDADYIVEYHNNVKNHAETIIKGYSEGDDIQKVQIITALAKILDSIQKHVRYLKFLEYIDKWHWLHALVMVGNESTVLGHYSNFTAWNEDDMRCYLFDTYKLPSGKIVSKNDLYCLVRVLAEDIETTENLKRIPGLSEKLQRMNTYLKEASEDIAEISRKCGFEIPNIPKTVSDADYSRQSAYQRFSPAFEAFFSE